MSPSLASLLKFRYLTAWVTVGILWLLAQLPYRWQLSVGRSLGRLVQHFSRRAKQVTEINLRLCFPNLTALERKNLSRKNFEAAGQGLLEAALAWFGDVSKLSSLLHIHGMEHIQTALQKGKGVIFCSAHFSALEITGRLLTAQLSFAVMYRPQKHPVFDYLAHRYRYRYYQQVIAREDLRGMIKALKKNTIVWYTPDIDAGIKNSIFAPFFGVMAATLTATSRLAAISQAEVVPIFYYRRDDGSGYDVHILPALINFPTDDLKQDATRINQLIEEAIRIKPEEYLWQYKRFKTRPPGEPRFYGKA